MSYSTTITYDTAASLNFDDDLVEIGGGVLRLKDQGGGVYTLVPQLVTSQYQIMASAFSTFAQSATTPANTSIGYQVVLNSIAYWYNPTSTDWEAVDTDNASAETNSASVINTNLSTLFTDLGIIETRYIGINIYLVTTDASARPLLASNTLTYTWANGNPEAIDQCLLYAYAQDLVGDIPGTATEVTLHVSNTNGFLHGSKFIMPFTKSVAFNSSGYAEISIIETETPGIPLQFSISFKDGYSKSDVRFINAIVPNTATAGINSLTIVEPYSFG